jgi:hypothetical protein
MTGPILTQPNSSILSILRNVTGRVDNSDPSFTDAIMYDYLNAFLQQEHPHEVQLFENRTWWDFSIDETTDDPLPVDLDALGYASINSPAYVSTVSPDINTFRMCWYENPSDFYARWPYNTTFTPQIPLFVLYYDNTLTFRGPPDQTYNIRLAAYNIDYSFAGGTISTPENSTLNSVPRAYLTRYLAYGAALDILSDYGEMDKYSEVYQVYRRYRAQVTAKTWNQLQSQRIEPQF